MKYLVLALCVWTCAVSGAREIEKINFADDMMIGTQKLVLNGVCLRKKKKFGMNFKVYVAGFYVAKKTKDVKEIFDSKTPMVLDMVYMRGIDRETLQEGWGESFKKVCDTCEKTKDHIKAFNDLITDVKEGDHFKITFEKDRVNIDNKSKKPKNGMIDGTDFRKNLLDMYFADHPDNADLKKCLLDM